MADGEREDRLFALILCAILQLVLFTGLIMIDGSVWDLGDLYNGM